MGIDLEYAQGEGPVIHNPVRTQDAVDRIRVMEPAQDVPFVLETIRKVKEALEDRIPLIGFAGAPFTLASYIIEGGHSRNFVLTKQLMYRHPQTWGQLMQKVTDITIRYLNAQIEAGAQAVQLFDSWVGCLSPDDYVAYVLPFSRRVFQGLSSAVPAIHFGTVSATLLAHMRDAGGDVIGADWRINLGEAWKRVGYDRAIQGNLDPVRLFGLLPDISHEARKILAAAENRPGHIFNLGHGILPETPVDHVKALVETVHELSQR
jgi:uroporphyrinogen decarboxylase